MTFSKELRKRILIALTDEKTANELESLITQALSNQPTPGEDPDAARRLVITRPAAEAVSALKLVRIELGQVYIASSDSIETSVVIGMALNSAAPGQDVVVLVYGIHEDSFFGFSPNEPLFLGPDGSVTNVPPTNGVLARIGSSLGLSQILLNIDTNTITL